MSADGRYHWGFVLVSLWIFNLSQVKSSDLCHLCHPPPFCPLWNNLEIMFEYRVCWSTESPDAMLSLYILGTKSLFLLHTRKIFPTGQPLSLLKFLCYYKCSNCELLNKILLKEKTVVFLHLFIHLSLHWSTKSVHFSMKQGLVPGLHLFLFFFPHKAL